MSSAVVVGSAGLSDSATVWGDAVVVDVEVPAALSIGAGAGCGWIWPVG